MLRIPKRLCVGLTTLLVSALACLVLVSAAAAGNSSPPPPVKYTMTVAPVGTTCMNNSGDVAGATNGCPFVALAPVDNEPTWTTYDLGEDFVIQIGAVGDGWPATPAFGTYIDGNGIRKTFWTSVTGINKSLQICGQVTYAESTTTDGVNWTTTYYRNAAFRYDWVDGGGKLQLTSLPNGDPQVVHMSVSTGPINVSGTIVGGYTTTGPNGLIARTVLVWNPDAPPVKQLDGPAVNRNDLVAINDWGQVAYCGMQSTGKPIGVLYTPGANQALDTYKTIAPLGSWGQYYSTASGINNFSEVVGQTTTTKSGNYAYTYTDATGVVSLGTLGGDSSAVGVNDAGQVVGYYYPMVKSWPVSKPFVYVPGKGMFALWNLISNRPSGMLDTEFGVKAINTTSSSKNFGQILASWSSQTYMLTPDR